MFLEGYPHFKKKLRAQRIGTRIQIFASLNIKTDEIWNWNCNTLKHEDEYEVHDWTPEDDNSEASA